MKGKTKATKKRDRIEFIEEKLEVLETIVKHAMDAEDLLRELENGKQIFQKHPSLLGEALEKMGLKSSLYKGTEIGIDSFLKSLMQITRSPLYPIDKSIGGEERKKEVARNAKEALIYFVRAKAIGNALCYVEMLMDTAKRDGTSFVIDNLRLKGEILKHFNNIYSRISNEIGSFNPNEAKDRTIEFDKSLHHINSDRRSMLWSLFDEATKSLDSLKRVRQNATEDYRKLEEKKRILEQRGINLCGICVGQKSRNSMLNAQHDAIVEPIVDYSFDSRDGVNASSYKNRAKSDITKIEEEGADREQTKFNLQSQVERRDRFTDSMRKKKINEWLKSHNYNLASLNPEPLPASRLHSQYESATREGTKGAGQQYHYPTVAKGESKQYQQLKERDSIGSASYQPIAQYQSHQRNAWTGHRNQVVKPEYSQRYNTSQVADNSYWPKKNLGNEEFVVQKEYHYNPQSSITRQHGTNEYYQSKEARYSTAKKESRMMSTRL